MRREFALLALVPGCSLVLDFSDKAVPKDAMIDAPYTDDQCAYKEPNDSFEAAAMIAPTDTGPAAICANDPGDYYKFTVAGATTVTVAIQFTNRPGGDLDAVFAGAIAWADQVEILQPELVEIGIGDRTRLIADENTVAIRSGADHRRPAAIERQPVGKRPRQPERLRD